MNENGTLMPFAPYQPATTTMYEHCKNFVDIPGGPQGVAPPHCLTRFQDIEAQARDALPKEEEKKGLAQL